MLKHSSPEQKGQGMLWPDKAISCKLRGAIDSGGLHQLTEKTDEDFHGRNVLHLSTTVLLRVHSRINRSLCLSAP